MMKESRPNIEIEKSLDSCEKIDTDENLLWWTRKRETESFDEIKSEQNRMNYPNLCGSIEPSEITWRVACDIVYAALKDMGELNQRSAIDQSKLNEQRILWKTKVVEGEKLQINEIWICFDERKDKT